MRWQSSVGLVTRLPTPGCMSLAASHPSVNAMPTNRSSLRTRNISLTKLCCWRRDALTKTSDERVQSKTIWTSRVILSFLRSEALRTAGRDLHVKMTFQHWHTCLEIGKRCRHFCDTAQKIYRDIHKSLRDFRTRLRNNQDRHGRKEHINR